MTAARRQREDDEREAGEPQADLMGGRQRGDLVGLHLGLDARAHVDRRPRRYVAVGPGGVLAIGGPGGIEKGRLRKQHVGALGVLAGPDRALAGGDFLHRPANMDGASPSATLG